MPPPCSSPLTPAEQQVVQKQAIVEEEGLVHVHP